MEPKKIFKLEDVDAGYNGKIILQNINLTVFEKDFIGIIGANGSGKTTLLKVILGLIKPARGNLHFYPETKGDPAKSIGYLPQISVFDRQFPITVFDAVIQGLISSVGLFKPFAREDKNTAHAMLEKLDILQLRNTPLSELSGGQLQRVFLARALISSPSLLLLDEPNTFVDKSFELNFFEILKKLNETITIILVSHDLGMISSYVKSIACVNRTLYFHESNEISQELLDNYSCPIDLITHGKLPHRVLKTHRSNCEHEGE